MTSFLVRAIAADIAATVRTTLRSPQYGHPVHRELAAGTGPCRQCLAAFNVGEEDRLLFTYSPKHDAPFTAQPGPVFIHADRCDPFDGEGFPSGLRDIPLTAEAHLRDGVRLPLHPLTSGDEDAQLSTLFEDEGIQFIHLRHAEAGCFIARIERQSHPSC